MGSEGGLGGGVGWVTGFGRFLDVIVGKSPAQRTVKYEQTLLQAARAEQRRNPLLWGLTPVVKRDVVRETPSGRKYLVTDLRRATEIVWEDRRPPEQQGTIGEPPPPRPWERTGPLFPLPRPRPPTPTPSPRPQPLPPLPPRSPIPRPGGPLYAQQPGSPQPPQSPVLDWLDAIARGLGRGLELRELLLRIMSLFQQPRGSGGGDFLRTTYTTEVQQMPYLMAPTGSMGGSLFGGGDLIGSLGGLAGGIASVIQAVRGVGGVMPGGSPFVAAAAGRALPAIVRALPGVAAGAAVGSLMGGSCPTRRGSGVFTCEHPMTGETIAVRSAGRPLLWSSDLAACKRVRKVARLAGRRAGGR